MNKIIDWRKITERKIAAGVLIISIITILINILAAILSAYYSKKTIDTSNNFNQKNFCYGKLQDLSGTVKDNLYILPTKISGCAIEPENFCEQARLIAEHIRTDSFEISSLLTESSSFRSDYETLTIKMQEILPILKQTDSNSIWFDQMLGIASEINELRINIKEVNLLKESCNDLN